MKAVKEVYGHRQELSTRRMFLCNRMNLDYFVRAEIDGYLRNHDKLNELYRWKEKIYEFFRIKGFYEPLSGGNMRSSGTLETGTRMALRNE